MIRYKYSAAGRCAMTLDAHKDWVGGANSLLCGGVVGELTRSLRLPNAASLMMDTASFLFLVIRRLVYGTRILAIAWPHSQDTRIMYDLALP